jgi:hypothetical protein
VSLARAERLYAAGDELTEQALRSLEAWRERREPADARACLDYWAAADRLLDEAALEAKA